MCPVSYLPETHTHQSRGGQSPGVLVYQLLVLQGGVADVSVVGHSQDVMPLTWMISVQPYCWLLDRQGKCLSSTLGSLSCPLPPAAHRDLLGGHGLCP